MQMELQQSLSFKCKLLMFLKKQQLKKMQLLLDAQSIMPHLETVFIQTLTPLESNLSMIMLIQYYQRLLTKLSLMAHQEELLCNLTMIQTVTLTTVVTGQLMTATMLLIKQHMLISLTQMTGIRHIGTTVLLVFILMLHMLSHKIAMSIKTMP
jgi:hypothetical protein